MNRFRQTMLRMLRSAVLRYSAVLLAGCAIVGFMDENSVWSHIRNKQEIADLKAEIEFYNAEHERDEARLRAIDTDYKVVEKIARERYFMKQPDEDIYVMGTR